MGRYGCVQEIQAKFGMVGPSMPLRMLGIDLSPGHEANMRPPSSVWFHSWLETYRYNRLSLVMLRFRVAASFS